MRDEYLTRWRTIDDRLELTINRAPIEGPHAKNFPFRVTVFELPQRKIIVQDLLAQWTPREIGAEAVRDTRRRLDRLTIELGAEPHLGQTYTLYFAHRSEDRSLFGGMTWAPVLDETPSRYVECMPELGARRSKSLMWPYDNHALGDFVANSWTAPYANYKLDHDGQD